MRLFKKLFSLIILGILALCSCSGSSSIPGKYSFMLGKKSQSHFGFSLELSEQQKGRDNADFAFDFDITESVGVLQFLVELNILHTRPKAKEEDPTIYYIDGTYTIGPVSDQGTELEIALNITTEIQLPPEALKLIIDCYVKDKNANMIIPVSMADLQCKMYWEGGIDTFDITKIRTDLPKHSGHPTAAEVKEIQETKQPKFRDWWTVTLGLIKES